MCVSLILSTIACLMDGALDTLQTHRSDFGMLNRKAQGNREFPCADLYLLFSGLALAAGLEALSNKQLPAAAEVLTVFFAYVGGAGAGGQMELL